VRVSKGRRLEDRDSYKKEPLRGTGRKGTKYAGPRKNNQTSREKAAEKMNSGERRGNQRQSREKIQFRN